MSCNYAIAQGFDPIPVGSCIRISNILSFRATCSSSNSAIIKKFESGDCSGGMTEPTVSSCVCDQYAPCSYGTVQTADECDLETRDEESTILLDGICYSTEEVADSSRYNCSGHTITQTTYSNQNCSTKMLQITAFETGCAFNIEYAVECSSAPTVRTLLIALLMWTVLLNY